MKVGLISDTHGLLRPQALEALAGADLILHAGDVGAEGVLQALARLAPVRAVRGNVDRGGWAARLPGSEFVEAGGTLIYLLHDLDTLDLEPAAAGVGVVLSGHTHRPAVFERAGVLYVNPGSAGPRRFRLPVSVGWLRLGEGGPRAEVVELEG
ncbi:phosphodiesterase [Calidithermus terrae]|uniref:Phosphoesterase n=1 Tax=Calidithermus terrae TaxID=1408545 RepID=A0A399EYX5_9DEIN|nr:metallophosphoesterase family protein [Calidithermus terrae]RIH87742.1 phosphodiesterase [Calidithermus terrae]